MSHSVNIQCSMNLNLTCILLLLNILNKKVSQIYLFQSVRETGFVSAFVRILAILICSMHLCCWWSFRIKWVRLQCCVWVLLGVRAQELCESWGGRPGLLSLINTTLQSVVDQLKHNTAVCSRSTETQQTHVSTTSTALPGNPTR